MTDMDGRYETAKNPVHLSPAGSPSIFGGALFFALRLSAVTLATMGLSAAAAFWARDHYRGVTQAPDRLAILVDQHFSDAETGWAVHRLWFPIPSRASWH
jgi:hypothetical protein